LCSLSTKRVHPNGDNTTAAELSVAMGAAPSQAGYVRLCVIRALLLGNGREAVCEMFDVSDRRVRLWVHRFNERGIDGLAEPPRGRGRARKIDAGELGGELPALIEDPSLAGEEHWTAVKLHGHLQERYRVELGYSTVVRYLHEAGYVLRFPRPWPTGPGKCEEKREAFRAELDALRERDDVRVWFTDETGVEGDPRPRRRWAQKGSAPKADYHGGHLRRTVIGAVQPEGGELFTMRFNGCDTEVFQCYLDHLAEDCPPVPGKQDILIMDNASWHKVKSLRWHHFEPLYLPPYSPDFNPIERLWKYLKEQFLADFYTRDAEELENKIDESLRRLIRMPERINSVTANW